MSNVQDYINNYNKEHYKTINTKVSPELFAQIDDFRKKNNLSIPKFLELSLNVIANYEMLDANYERAKKALKNLSDNGWEVIGEKEKEIVNLKEERDNLKEENANLKEQIQKLKSRNIFDYLFSGLQSGGGEKF